MVVPTVTGAELFPVRLECCRALPPQQRRPDVQHFLAAHDLLEACCDGLLLGAEGGTEAQLALARLACAM